MTLLLFPLLTDRVECRIKKIPLRRPFVDFQGRLSEVKGKILLSGFLAKNVNCFKLYLGKNLKGLELQIRTLIKNQVGVCV